MNPDITSSQTGQDGSTSDGASFPVFHAPETPRAQLAMDALLQRETSGIPTWIVHVMEHAMIERLAGAGPGDYLRDPERVYLRMEENCGVCLLDQYLWDNPLTMTAHGYEEAERGATTGARRVERDGVMIDSPEAVVEHLEQVVFPALERQAAEFDEDARAREIVLREQRLQDRIGPEILKAPYGCVMFPGFAYGVYGYEHYFSAYALYPEVMEKHFRLQADVAVRNNRAAGRAFTDGKLPPLCRLDHDMADSRGMLVRIETLDRLWLPHFVRSLEPLLKTDVRLLWHCDGNLMDLVPRLLEAGISGFQGFQYEDGMDYRRICRMKAKDGRELIIFAGVSVTRTLPMGTPADVREEMRFLVENGPRTGLFLGASSSIAPGVPWENLKTFVEGLHHYRLHGRG